MLGWIEDQGETALACLSTGVYGVPERSVQPGFPSNSHGFVSLQGNRAGYLGSIGPCYPLGFNRLGAFLSILEIIRVGGPIKASSEALSLVNLLTSPEQNKPVFLVS